MFAFALWDARRQRLLLGRDRLGIKPLYLWNDGRRLVFASEAKAILALPGMSAELDPAALTSYLTLGYVPAPQSIFRGIRKLPPATLLSAERGKVDERRYWRVPADVDRAPSEHEWVDRVRARLEESVRMQMVSDVPIGAFLSGGVDSSAVVAFMAAHSDRPVKTYAIGFDGGEAEDYYNELPYARQVAQRFGTDHHEILVRPDVASLLPQLLWHMDEPIADTAFITTYLVSQFARRDVTVILSGVGGDELFGGYRRYLGSHYQAYFDRLPPGCAARRRRSGEKLPSDRHSPLLNALRLAKGFLSTAGLPFDERYRSYVEVFPGRRRHGAAAPAAKRRARRACRRVRGGDEQRRAEPDAVGRRANAAARRSAAADRQDEHGGVARVPRAAARSRAGRAGRANAAGSEDTRRTAQARAEGRAAGRSAARTSSSARSAASARRWAPGSRASSRRWCASSCRPRRSRRADCSGRRKSPR